jgi:hypothetical protein
LRIESAANTAHQGVPFSLVIILGDLNALGQEEKSSSKEQISRFAPRFLQLKK